MTVSIVAAVSRNGVIGAGGGMPWRIPEDLRRFRKLTMGGVVIMGRRTFDSIGKPLDGRVNIVISRNPNFRPEQGAKVGEGGALGIGKADSLETALMVAEAAKADADVFIIGGGEIYALALREAVAERMFLTEVDLEVEGDVFFPPFSRDEWRETDREAGSGNVPHFYVRRERTERKTNQ